MTARLSPLIIALALGHSPLSSAQDDGSARAAASATVIAPSSLSSKPLILPPSIRSQTRFKGQDDPAALAELAIESEPRQALSISAPYAAAIYRVGAQPSEPVAERQLPIAWSFLELAPGSWSIHARAAGWDPRSLPAGRYSLAVALTAHYN